MIDEVFLAHYELVEKKDLNSLKDGEFFYQQKVDEVDTTLAMCVKIDRQNDIAHHDKEVVKRYLTDLFSTIPHGVQLVMFVTIGNFGSQIIEIEH
ncbi:hypothetical protein [Photobacterium damselae]|uniref:hypothetical protein n=1 Tax=Photobacterium damselae TaxID=38293 RepID=UPI001F3DD095|nr:hypothetical protein [Photobacterium damselae]UKA31806.1 hypothetical protein IPQ37_21305 [Photobacterium damselae subsp. damselae]